MVDFIFHTAIVDFPDSARKAKKFDAGVHRKYIFGGHVANYMKELKESDEDTYKKQFSKFVAAGLTADKMEALYKKAHAAIRADPSKQKKERKASEKKKRWNRKKLSLAEKKNNVQQKKKSVLQKLGQGDE